MANRDRDIQSVFEGSDDSLLGVLGYYFYTISMKYNVSEGHLWNYLPTDRIPHTFSWDRFYDKQELTREMGCIFEMYQSRITLVFIVNVFEVALYDFVNHLNNKNMQQTLETPNKPVVLDERVSYKTLIKWAYQEAKKCGTGDFNALIRLPETFGKIDDARRLRNLVVHNSGLFGLDYKKDAIKENSIITQMHSDYQRFDRNQQIKVPIILKPYDVVDFSRAHIEALHVLHNSIQRRYFEVKDPYSYINENKKIEWKRIFRGI